MSASESYKDGDGGTCTCIKYYQTTHFCGKEQQPAAESVKPCPFCGETKRVQLEPRMDANLIKHTCYGVKQTFPLIDWDAWQNAWSHRRISELEEIHKQDLIKHERLERRNAELERINRQDWNKGIERIVGLERQLKEATLDQIALNDQNGNLQRQIGVLEQQVRELREKE